MPWTRRAALVLLVGFIAVVTMVGVVTLARATSGLPQLDEILDGRLVAPLGYQNAAAALWTIAALPALALAASSVLPRVARPPLLAAAGFLLGLAVLAQSRGWLLTLPVVALLTLAMVGREQRAAIVLFALPVAGAVGLAVPRLLEPYEVGGARPAADVAQAVHHAMGPAATSLMLVAAALLVVGVALVWAAERFAGQLERAGTAIVVVLAVGAIAAGLVATHGDPIGRADSAWAEFKDYKGTQTEAGTSRFSDLSSVRYDFWRVGLNAFLDHPIGGLGQDNFATTYVRERETPATEARWLHSLELRALVHTGVVGAGLLAAFLLAAAIAAVRGPRVGAVALLPAIVWLCHGSVDWLWEYPALSGPALALAGVAAALAGQGEPLRVPRIGLGVAVAVALAGSVVIVGPYVAERDVRNALSNWRSDPAGALDRLDRARGLNPLASRASLVEGLIAVRLGREDVAGVAFAEAADRDAGAWLPRLQLGLAASAAGQRGLARRFLTEARARNPLGATVREALRRVGSVRPMTRLEAAASIAREAASQRGITQVAP
jgi:hypothetical protein